ncbi:MAG: hypothetical protein V1858_01455 [Candidatus Gottesmanbacteria bacterium]
MLKQTDNVCIRCGKLRIETKTWKEKTPSGFVTHTLSRCPDSDCQKIIDQQFAVQKLQREAREENKHRQIELKKKNLHPSLSLKTK